MSPANIHVRDLARWLDGFAPQSLAESWDNVGLLWGDPDAPVERLMTCLTVTPQVADEAVRERAELIVSHHPVLFRGAKKVVAGPSENGMLWPLARAGVAILSPHTAFDNTVGGINDGLAARLGLVEVAPLRASPPATSHKVVVFTPAGALDAVREAAFEAGAGRIGNYERCSFSGEGTGTFFGNDASNPAVGQAERLEEVAELRLELLCDAVSLAPVVLAVRAAHPYEEPAIDVYPLQPPSTGPGSGRLGRLAAPESLDGFARRVSGLLASPGLQYVGDPGRTVGRVAIVCGAGDDFLPDAARARADVLLTGEARYHRAVEAERLGVGLVVAGHHATERPGVEDLAARIVRDFPGLDVWPSRVERDPLRTPS